MNQSFLYQLNMNINIATVNKYDDKVEIKSFLVNWFIDSNKIFCIASPIKNIIPKAKPVIMVFLYSKFIDLIFLTIISKKSFMIYIYTFFRR